MMQLDPTAFFNTAELAIDATLNGADVAGILSITPVTTFDVDGEAPTFTLPASDVAADPRSQSLVIAAGVHPSLPAGATYTVQNFRAAGPGVTTLILMSS